ncbi:uncharacterized protein EI90DRAFT_786781 [Cantharellus anzutake]|uniref:uncharacterized protein n=1 Tax=Cantharellus anzutake TaxID=1750568 RepID=UPI001908D269|nr:uncharacterized protein EI90DRAFT_786781 [Cantharellus anzutake]KAF8342780.1 hypothetical protein EI90DRAFT_786781 [Cantharellus anzutake]
MNPRRNMKALYSVESNNSLGDSYRAPPRRATSVSFSSVTTEGSALYEPFVPPPPPLPINGLLFDGPPRQRKRSNDTWVNLMPSSTSPKPCAVPARRSNSAPPSSPPLVQVHEIKPIPRRLPPPIPIPPRNPNRPLSAIISVDSRQDVSANSTQDATVTTSDTYHSASSNSTPNDSPVVRPLTPLSPARSAGKLDEMPSTAS